MYSGCVRAAAETAASYGCGLLFYLSVDLDRICRATNVIQLPFLVIAIMQPASETGRRHAHLAFRTRQVARLHNYTLISTASITMML